MSPFVSLMKAALLESMAKTQDVAETGKCYASKGSLVRELLSHKETDGDAARWRLIAISLASIVDAQFEAEKAREARS